jgi:hypothetical protein
MYFKFIFKSFNILLLLLIMFNQSFATEEPWKGETTHRPLKSVEEGFTRKDERYFVRTLLGMYLPVENFDRVFPLATTQHKTLQMFVSQIFMRLNSTTEATGSATVTKSDGYTFEAVSAKHNFMHSGRSHVYPGQPHMYRSPAHMLQGRGIVDGKTNYLFRGVIEEVCPSRQRDIALIKGRYEDDGSLPNREQRQLLKNSVTTLCSSPTISSLGVNLFPFRYGFFGSIIDRIVRYPIAHVLGYPAGVSDQRLRSGLVFPSLGRHEISTLPGDSGAGLFRQINGSYHLFGIHTGGSVDYPPIRSVKVQLPKDQKSFEEYRYNQFHELTLKNLGEEFSSCVRIEKRPLRWRLQYGISSFFDRP